MFLGGVHGLREKGPQKTLIHAGTDLLCHRDCQSTPEEEKEMSDPKYKVGDVVGYHHGCYGQVTQPGGPTASFQIATVSKDHGGPGIHRYYGQHCLGGVVGAYEDQICDLDAVHRSRWEQNAHWRKTLKSFTARRVDERSL